MESWESFSVIGITTHLSWNLLSVFFLGFSHLENKEEIEFFSKAPWNTTNYNMDELDIRTTKSPFS